MPERIVHPQWLPAASPPAPLRQGTVDVWRVDLAAVQAEAMQLLCPRERARAAAIEDPARRALWMRARGVLRALLGAYLQRPAEELQFVLGAHGKPALAREAGTAPLTRPREAARPREAGTAPLASLREAVTAPHASFNLSHSGTLALYAFTLAAELGIDVEMAGTRARRNEPALAARMWGPEQAQRLRLLPSRTRAREFLRLWVAHEAALKCSGRGLGGSTAQESSADSGPGGSGAAESAPSEGLWLAELDLGAPAVAALAIQGGPQELRFWRHTS
jgi:4'-phosphopantetheinyl transferase